MWFDQMIVVRGTRRVAAAAVAFVVAFVVAGLLATAAWPRMHYPARGHRIVASGAGDTGPIGGYTPAVVVYSTRQVVSGYAGKAFRIRRASDNAELDIGYLGFVPGTGAPLDVAAANTHCAATNCFGVAWYNQGSGGSTYDGLQATPASQPALFFNCQNGLPCWRSTAVAQKFVTAGSYNMTNVVHSMSAVARRNSGTNTCWFFAGNNGLQSAVRTGAAGNWLTGGSAAPLSAPAAEATIHAGFGSVNGASSVFRIDGTETTGTTSGAANSGLFSSAFGGGTTSCDMIEGIFWEGLAGDAAMRAAVTANQRSYWAF